MRAHRGAPWALIVALALVAGGCPAVGCTADGSTFSVISTADGRRQDIESLIAQLEQVHPDPYHGTARRSFRAAADALAAEANSLRADEFLVGVMRLVGLLGARGREGHSGVWPWDNAVHRLPLRLWEFPEGLFITGGAEQYSDLVGARISHVDGMPVDQVLARLEPLIPRDNPTTVLMHRPIFFVCAEVLSGLGIAKRPDVVTLRAVKPGGAMVDVDVGAVDARTFDALVDGWEWILPDVAGSVSLGHRDQPYHVEYLATRRAVYFQYNAVQPSGAALASALRQAIQGRRVDRVVLDLRDNHGGDNTTYRAFVDYLTGPEVDRPGRLWVLAGRLTFSAAGNFAAELADGADHEVFVGEPTGGSPNQFGDHTTIRLPHTGITVTSATEWVQVSQDDRLATGPDLAVAYRAGAYFAGRDPVLEVALTAVPPN